MLLLYRKAIGGVGMGHEKIKNFAKNFDADFCLLKNCLRAVPVTASRPSAPYPPASSREPTGFPLAARFCADLLPWVLWAVWVDLFGVAARGNPTAEQPPGFGRFGSSHLKSVFDFIFDDPKRPNASGGGNVGTGRGLGALGHLGGLGHRFPVAPNFTIDNHSQ